MGAENPVHALWPASSQALPRVTGQGARQDHQPCSCEILALDIDDLDLPGRRAKVTSKGGDTEWVHWASGTAHLLPRLLRGRAAGPVFISHRRPAPSRRPPARDLCPDTGKARLGYGVQRVLERNLARLPDSGQRTQ